uniref:Uncharacterized protein n=1 Tax=Callorhinchus milii TaxID=7868 RepID=A0A4W3GEY5_CALMI
MLSLRNQKNAAILIILYTMKRTVSEHQEMHDRSRFLQEMRRQKWLEEGPLLCTVFCDKWGRRGPSSLFSKTALAKRYLFSNLYNLYFIF